MEKRLGRGLDALIPDKTETAGKVMKIGVEEIKPNRFQPRKKFDSERLRELKDSIREKGIIQPIIVRPVDGGYELIAGERRLRALKELGFTQLPVIIKDVGDADSLELSLIENIQREELNPIEEANAYRELIERFNLTYEEISKQVGKDKSTIANTIRLLSLPELLQEYLADNLLTIGHAKAILSLPGERARIRLAKKVIKRNLSVRQTEEIVRQKLERPVKKRIEKDEELARIEEELQHHLGTRVKIIHGKKRGRIEIFYFSSEDLERILNLIKR